MRKIRLILSLLVGLLAASCAISPSASSSSISSASSSVLPLESTVNLYTVNDTHGALEDGKFSKIGAYFSSVEEDQSLFLSAGDMFQGTALSNITRGRAMIRAMNEIGFDAMTIGNHEFDWGLDAIHAFWDGDESNGEADFPLLGANVYDRATNERLPWLEDYVIFERSGVRIAVIGVIGYGLESSIAYSMVEDYEFKNPVPIIGRIARSLRTLDQADIVVVSAHDESINSYLLDLTGVEQVDAVINGHVHQNTAGILPRSPQIGLPYVQAGSSASHFGRISLTYRFADEKLINVRSQTYAADSLSARSAGVDAIVAEETQAVAPIIERELGTLGETFTRNDYGYDWSNDVLYRASGADLAFNNEGGIRAPLYNDPFDQNSIIRVADIYRIVPFDNVVVLVSMTKTQIEAFLRKSGAIFSSGFTYEGGTAFLDGVPLQTGRTYRVATLDFLFDNPYYPFLEGTDVIRTGVLFRDLMIEDVEAAMTVHGAWYPSRGSVLTAQLEN